MSDLMAELGVISALGILTWYSFQADDKNDFFFIFRKKQFRKKLLKCGYDSLWSFLDTLLDTTENDWQFYDSKSMIATPFPNTIICFSNNGIFELEIIEGSGYVELFNLRYSENENQMYNGYDYLTKQHLKTTDHLRFEQILFHLEQILQSIQKNAQNKTQSVHKQNETFVIEKKKQLKIALQDNTPVHNKTVRQGFVFERTEEPQCAVLSISLEDKQYFQAIYFKKSNKLVTKFHHRDQPFGLMFRELEDSLHTFATKQLIQQVLVRSFETKQQEMLKTVQTLLAQLVQERQWLSDESYHHVTETFPKDLEALQDVYRVVRSKEQVQEVLTQSLKTMIQKLEGFFDEAETNKRKEMEKRKLVIEKR